MDSTQRQAIYSKNIRQAVNTNEKIVIFEDPASGRYVQFAVSAPEKTLILDIPLISISQKEYESLQPHMDIINDIDGNPLSFQKIISTVQIDYAAQYVEWVFTKIFLLPNTHEVTTQVFT